MMLGEENRERNWVRWKARALQTVVRMVLASGMEIRSIVGLRSEDVSDASSDDRSDVLSIILGDGSRVWSGNRRVEGIVRLRIDMPMKESHQTLIRSIKEPKDIARNAMINCKALSLYSTPLLRTHFREETKSKGVLTGHSEQRSRQQTYRGVTKR